MSIKIENLRHVYMPNTPFEKVALDNVNIEINNGEFVALIGHTGSGKSTLIQHMNVIMSRHYGKRIENPSLMFLTVVAQFICMRNVTLLEVNQKF